MLSWKSNPPSPAPAGFKWKMVARGEVVPAGKLVVPSRGVIRDANWVGATRHNRDGSGRSEWWYLVPAPALAWRNNPLEVVHKCLPTNDLRRETVDGIIADFIRTVSDEKTFRAYLRAAKKGLTEADFD